MGGLDLFKMEKDKAGIIKVQNMGYPINSNTDDFSIVFESDIERGFFSSSRMGGDDDIFSFVLPPIRFNLLGTVYEEGSDKIIADAEVKLIGSDGYSMEAKSDDKGKFKFMLKPSTDYIILATANGYLKGKGKQTTRGTDQSSDFNITINLPSIESPIELPNIFYDFGAFTLRDESKVSLDKLVETLIDNPNITIELMSHTDSRGGEEENEILSQKRAQSAVDYLIEKGIAEERLKPKGYGESMPKKIDERMNSQAPFFPVDAVLTEGFINSLGSDDYMEIAHQINRRTEFKVLTTTYRPRGRVR